MAIWGGISGAAPHVLHHIGPIAGSALVAGAAGKALFAVVGLVASLPFLLKLHRRYETWLAPAIGLAAFALAFAVSTLLVGPMLSGDESEVIHEDHHPAAGQRRHE